MRFILFLPVLPLFFATTMAVPCLHSTVFEQLPAPVNGTEMWVKNDKVFQNETFLLRFKAPNPQFMGVLDPAGHFFYVAYPASTSIGNLMPFIDSNLFVHLDSLQIPTGQMKADPYTYGVTENQAVFTQSGIYTFILGENLHIDDPTELHQVKIKYKHSPRPIQEIALKY